MEVKKKWKVKRNIARFPEDFMFELTRDKVELMKLQFVTLNKRGIFKVTNCDFERKWR